MLMNQQDDIEYQLDTLAIRTGHNRTSEGEHSEPIFLTSSFVCESAADAAAKFSGQIEGNTYSRYTNPTVQTFEKRLAVLDGAEAAVATSSGMAGVHAVTEVLPASPRGSEVSNPVRRRRGEGGSGRGLAGRRR